MIDQRSRYIYVKHAILEREDGRHISYLRRRFLPQGEKLPVMLEATVGVGDRLDTIAFQTLGDPLQFWQIADANNALNPLTLTDETGRRLKVPAPHFPE